MQNELIEAWRRLDLSRAPFILKGDEELRKKHKGKELIHSYGSYEEYIADEDHGRRHKAIFHTGLLPVPYAGNLAKAEVFLLLGNPGFGAHDYYAEYGVQNFRNAVIQSLQQKNGEDLYPMIYLDPRFAWHGGGIYWQNKLSNILLTMEGTYVSALQCLSQRLAVLESVPYHSTDMSFSAPVRKLLQELPSVQLMSAYVREMLVPRAQSGEISIIDLRGKWDLPEEENIIVYKKQERVSALLTLGSRGGKKIVDFLKLKLRPKKS
jgi:hypothetical protein